MAKIVVIGAGPMGLAVAYHGTAEHVISTIPTPNISRPIPVFPEDRRASYEAKNIGICCVVFKLKRSVNPHFWINLRPIMRFLA